MNCKFINVLMFAAGAAVGSAVTWKVVKTRYERIVQEEIESIKEAFAGNEPEVDQEQTEEDSDTDDEGPQIDWSELEDLEDEEDDADAASMEEYAQLVKNYTNEKGGAEGMSSKIARDPYVISPYDFGEIDEFHKIELTYYADGTLEDEDYNIVEDVVELLGPKALNTFGEYEDDAVFVRNEHLSTDFQVLKDYRTYEEAKSAGPKWVGNE